MSRRVRFVARAHTARHSEGPPPFVALADDYLALCDSAALVMIYFCCVMLQLKTLTETDEISAVLSPKLRSRFDLPVALLSAIMLVSVLATLVFCGFLVVVQTIVATPTMSWLTTTCICM